MRLDSLPRNICLTSTIVAAVYGRERDFSVSKIRCDTISAAKENVAQGLLFGPAAFPCVFWKKEPLLNQC
jgi:hypothetical protein